MTSIFHESDTSVERIKVVCSSNERRGYEKRSAFFIHPIFNGEKEWPMTTDIVCRYDGEPFSSIPIPLPIDYNTETNTYSCYGIFCSAACVKAFMENNPVYSNALSMIWLKKIMCEIFNDFEDIIEAPPIDLLMKHGGDLTIEQFRAFGRQKTRIITHRMPFFTCALAFELVKDYGGESKAQTVEKESRNFKKLHRQKKQSDKPTTNQTPEIPVISLIQPQSGTTLPEPCKTQSVDILPSIMEIEECTAVDKHSDHAEHKIDKCDDENPSNHLLPNTITLVPATVGNQWEIRGLKRPQIPIEIQTQSTQQNTKSLFQEYIEKKTHNKSSTNQTSTITDSKPQKRRGRPKMTKSKPDSPKQNPNGSLINFLKVK
jgi:hypothetical protein